MKVFVFGNSGMLGKYVHTYLNEKSYTVVGVGRNDVDASKDEKSIENFIKNNVNKDDVIINCMGTIKPRVDELGDINAIRVNSLFPRLLADVCEKYGVKLIHPTTDCVYNGNKGNYNENDPYDVSDVYGMSKALGEPNNCTVIRTSIIGEEVGQGRSLVEWVKGNKNGKTNGYLNHYWNGVTCLEFAKIVDNMMSKGLYWKGIKHLHSNSVNKFDLSSMINVHFNLNINISPVEVEVSSDRTLSTLYEDNITLFNIPNLDTQIKEMSEYHETLFQKQYENIYNS